MLETKAEGFIPGGFVEALGEAAVAQVLSQVADAARSEWIRLANEKLTSTLTTYVRGIQPVADYTSGSAGVGKIITLAGALPNALEEGQKAYDMHDTLLGPNVPVVPAGKGLKGKHPKKGGGFYRAIPFRHQTPGTDGQFGAPMGSAYAGLLGVQEAAALGQAIYAKAKDLSRTTGMPGEKIKWGTSLPAGLAPKLRPHHHSDIYANMYKQSKHYEQVTQSSYVSFRTIGTGSPGWLRRATPGVHLAEHVKEYIETSIIRQAFEALLEGATAK